MMDSPRKLMEEQKKLEEELLDDNSEMSGTEEGFQLLDVSMEEDEGGATTDFKPSASHSISDTPATSKGGPSVPAPVPAPVSAPVGAQRSATSKGGPPELTRQVSLTGGPPPSDNSSGGQVSASVVNPARPQPQLATALGGIYTAIAKYQKTARSAPFLLPGRVRVSNHYGSLFTLGDNRARSCFSDFRFGDKQSLMFSFNPSTLRCNCCTDKAFVSEHGERRAIILSDQNFSPIIRAGSGGGCTKIIRLKNGGLEELSEVLLGLLRSFNVSIPAGSAILIGSASYLAEVGTQYYCEEFCRIRKKLL